MIELPRHTTPCIPARPSSIQKGVALAEVLNQQSVAFLARNIQLVDPKFDVLAFTSQACTGLDDLSLMQRGQHIATALHSHLAGPYAHAIDTLSNSLSPVLDDTENNGLAVFFYLPHSFFISHYGISAEHNLGADPFEASMTAMYQLTQRFTAEFCIRPFLLADPTRTLAQLQQWLNDDSPHVRRLCSEGCRPKLPWGMHLPVFLQPPYPTLALLQQLKYDSSLYVQRSVANHLADIAKADLAFVLSLCSQWLEEANRTNHRSIKWIIRHSLRHPAKNLNPQAIALRIAAK